MRLNVRWMLGLVIAGVALIAPSTAAAKAIGYAVEDPAGDAPHPQLDLRAASLRFDRAQARLTGSVTLGEPASYVNIESIEIALGRAQKRTGACATSRYVIVAAPTPEEQEAGLLWPFAELYADGDEPLGFLPTDTDSGESARIQFGSDEAVDAPVHDELARMRVNCAEIASFPPDGEYAADVIDDLPLLTGPAPACRFTEGSAVPNLRLKCTNLAGKVTARVYRRGARPRAQRLRVRGGRVAVRTGNAHGRLQVTLWQQGTIVTRLYLRVK